MTTTQIDELIRAARRDVFDAQEKITQALRAVRDAEPNARIGGDDDEFADACPGATDAQRAEVSTDLRQMMKMLAETLNAVGHIEETMLSFMLNQFRWSETSKTMLRD